MRTAWTPLLALAIACGGGTSTGTAPGEGTTPGVAASPADNTRINERDRSPDAVTPMQQGEDAGDLEITRRIRQDVVQSGDLSMSAKNVKIITKDGVVTLRGPVKTPQERTEIADIAQRVAGVKQVDNQLEITAG